MINIQKLNPREQKSDLVKALNIITTQAFGKEVTIAETEERFADADALFLVRDEERVIGYGFNDILNLDGKTVNYFGSGFIAPEFQGQGLYGILNKERVEQIQADAIMTRTQNPRVVSGFRRVCYDLGYRMSPCNIVTPRVLDPRLAAGFIKLHSDLGNEMSPNGIITPAALMIARAYAPECTLGLVCEGVYGRELMGDTPIPEGETAQILHNVNPKKGDGIILIGEK